MDVHGIVVSVLPKGCLGVALFHHPYMEVDNPLLVEEQGLPFGASFRTFTSTSMIVGGEVIHTQLLKSRVINEIHPTNNCYYMWAWCPI